MKNTKKCDNYFLGGRRTYKAKRGRIAWTRGKRHKAQKSTEKNIICLKNVDLNKRNIINILAFNLAILHTLRCAEEKYNIKSYNNRCK